MKLDSANPTAPEPWREATRQLVRALRGPRSQVAFSRRLGYRSNVAADWEGGHRAPTASTLFHALGRVGLDVPSLLHAFDPATAGAYADGVPAWLDALRGQATQKEIAARSGASRHQVRRWLSGEAEPRVPDLLCLLHALTGRAPDFVASLVDIDRVPALATAHRAARAAARLAYDAPWAAAIRVLVNTDGYRSDPTDAYLAASLGVDEGTVRDAVSALLDAGLVVQRRGRLEPVSAFTADASASDDDRRRLKAHWARVAADRLARSHGHPDDLVSLNLVTLSRADLERVRQLQRDHFRALRSLVAASAPEEVAALVLLQTLALAPPE
jgi:transcriptional regulator with XRE-family HTH domain